MMKQPDQQIHDEIIKRASLLGYRAFPFLPKDGTQYPFVVMGETMILPRPTKTRLLGRLTATVHVWGDNSNRKLISDMIATLMENLSTIKQIEDRKWAMSFENSTSEIIKDNSTDELLYHGIIDLEFKFY